MASVPAGVEGAMTQQDLQDYMDKKPFAKLRDVVYDLLYDKITGLEIKPGTKLNINQIAASLGISRTPIAEAVTLLYEKGFVVTHPEVSGYFVLSLSMSDMINLYSMRGAVECEAASLCTERADKETIRRLETLAQEFETCVVSKDIRGMIDTDLPFHGLIVKSSQNTYIQQCYDLILPKLTMYEASMMEFIGTRHENPWSSSVLYNHSAIVSAIKMHIPTLARQAMNDHVRASLNFTIFSNDGTDPFKS